MLRRLKIILTLILGLFSTCAMSAEVTLGYELGNTKTEQVIQDLSSKNKNYKLTDESFSPGDKKFVKQILIYDGEFLGLNAANILYFDEKNTLGWVRVLILDNKFPRDQNSIFMSLGKKISSSLFNEGFKFKSGLNYLIEFPSGQRKGTFLRKFCDFDEKKDKDFLWILVISAEPHEYMMLEISLAETQEIRDRVWAASAKKWNGK